MKESSDTTARSEQDRSMCVMGNYVNTHAHTYSGVVCCLFVECEEEEVFQTFEWDGN